MTGTQTTPEVSWAQRSSATDDEKNVVYLTVFAPDVPDKDLKVSLTATNITVTGASTTKNTTYHVSLDLFADVDVENSKTLHTARDVAFVLRKKENKEEYWPRLTKDKARLHFLKTDFDKWVDEDEQNETNDDELMSGMGNMGAMGGDGGFGGIDFSKLGGGMDMGDFGGAGGEEAEEEDDDEMPGLAEEGDEGKGKDKADADKPKIEEVA